MFQTGLITRKGEDVNEVLKAIPASRLKKLEIAFDGPTTYQTRPRINNNHVTGEPHKEELVITDSFAGQFAEFGFKKLCIERCQAVESLRIENCRELGLSEFLDAVRTSCRKLNRLDYFSDGEEDDTVIQQLLTTSRSRWKETAAQELLRSHVTTLEALKCDKWKRYDDDDLFHFLWLSQKLVRFECIQVELMLTYISELRLDAFNMVSLSKNRPWGLGKSVEYFQLRIENIPRPDFVCQIDGRPLGNEEHSLEEAVQPVEDEDGVVWADDEKVLPQKNLAKRYEIQRWVLTQLGRMTGLKELNLGVPDTVSSPVTKDGIDARTLGDFEHPGHKLVWEFNYQSLEFSLESGLELLAGLKELQVLDVRWTAHRIGVEE
ncbi:MAG: hypothetical protein J3R72DRAFT_427944 [Linnemannia gamsii]|nr:MAG: hypothetical protein J3R72DRAFT_427944 [Linnemannia gamsii]